MNNAVSKMDTSKSHESEAWFIPLKFAEDFRYEIACREDIFI